jgi:hypothetical protein
VNRSISVEAGVATRRESPQSTHWLWARLGGLEQPVLQRAVVSLALVLCIPTLYFGFALDDYVLLTQMAQPDSSDWAGRAPFDLFRWFDPANTQRLMDGAGLPWWTLETARLSFFRPLSSLSHAVDDVLFPHSAVLMHLHNLAWFGLLLWLACKAYRELINDRWAIAVASAMFALDCAHGSVLAWISNRNALIAGVLGIGALICHHRARSYPSLAFAAIAWLYFGLSLLSAELAVGVCGYLIAYEVFLDRGTWSRRALSLVPYGAILALWAIVRKLGGYGSYGIGSYVDPLGEPAEFLRMLPVRWVQLAASQLSHLAADMHGLVPAKVAPWLSVAAASAVSAVIWFMWPALRRHAVARFFAFGAALSVLPLAATIPADRVLVFVGFGALPALAIALRDALHAPRRSHDSEESDWTPLRRRFGVVLAAVHLVLSPLFLPVSAWSIAWIARWTESAERSVPLDANTSNQVLIVAAVPDSLLLTYVPTMRAFAGKPSPKKLYWLDGNAGDALLERRAENTLRVFASQGLFDRRSEARSFKQPLHPGDKIVLSEVTIQVLELNRQGLPSACDFVFASPLESPHYRWQTWQDGKLQTFVPPKLGDTAKISVL